MVNEDEPSTTCGRLLHEADDHETQVFACKSARIKRESDYNHQWICIRR